jgi:crossover junction endodeoxyribonuclease RuvC
VNPVIAAIDPGTRKLGFCIVDGAGRAIEMGVIAPAGKSLPERLLQIQDGIDRLFARHRPSEVAVETPYVGRNAASALTLAAGRALALTSAARVGAKVFEYTAPEAKRAVTGSGASGKSSVQRVIQLLLGLASLPSSDAADAAALAICHQGRRKGP